MSDDSFFTDVPDADVGVDGSYENGSLAERWSRRDRKVQKQDEIRNGGEGGSS